MKFSYKTILINTNTEPTSPRVLDDKGHLLPSPLPSTLLDAGTLRVIFFGDNLPTETDTLELDAKLHLTGDQVILSTGTRVSDDDLGDNVAALGEVAAYDFAVSLNALKLAEQVDEHHTALLDAGILVLSTDGDRAEWSMLWNVEDTASNEASIETVTTARDYAEKAKESAEKAEAAAEKAEAAAASVEEIKEDAEHALAVAEEAKETAAAAGATAGEAKETAEAAKATAEETAAQLSGLTEDLTAEETARKEGDATLQANIDAEAQARAEADTTLQSSIEAEAQTRATADSDLDAKITTETQERESATSVLSEQIAAETERATTAEATLTAQLSAEETARKETDEALQDAVNANSSAISDNTAKIETNATAIATETARATTAEEALSASLSTVETTATQALSEAQSASEKATENATAIDELKTQLATDEVAIQTNSTAIADLQSASENYVTLDGNQTIAGTKMFSNGVYARTSNGIYFVDALGDQPHGEICVANSAIAINGQLYAHGVSLHAYSDGAITLDAQGASNIVLQTANGTATYNGNELATLADIPDVSSFATSAVTDALEARIAELEAKING